LKKRYLIWVIFGITIFSPISITSQNYIAKKTISHSVLLISNPDSNTFKQRDSVKSKSWWEPLFDINFWSKLSGPGPFIGLGIDYPVIKYSDIFAISIGTDFSHSIDNTLQYYIPIYGNDSSQVNQFLKDSCIFCRQSKSVKILSVRIEALYHIHKSPIDILFGSGFHTFFGETFKTFSRFSGSIGIEWHALKYILVGLTGNIFKRFYPSDFGAINSKEIPSSIEFIPGGFVKIYLH